MAKQWHPKFADLLRPLVEQYYDVQTNMPVGDVPRAADLVLLRRKKDAPPFRGLWRHLRTWNVIEYKGPSVSARIDDIDLLVELGLGIHRRLNSELAKLKVDLVPASEVSFWYLANHLGRRFRRSLESLIGPVETPSEGVWQCRLLDRSIFFVSDSEVPIEADSLPLHLLSRGTVADEIAMGQLVLTHPALTDLYGAMLAGFHKEVLEELYIMARTARKGQGRGYDLDKIIEYLGTDDVIRHLENRFIETANVEKVIKKFGAERVMDALSKDKVMLSQLKRLLAREDR